MKKKIVLLGDSIRQIGYGTVIQNYFNPEEVDIWQPVDNCRFVKYTLRMLFEEKANIEGADVIHWNNGLWDVTYIFEGDERQFTPFEEYKENMLRVADLLLKMGKKVIFATTTPVREDNPYNKNETIASYNARIVPLLKEKGIYINDIYSLVNKDINRYIREDDKIHLSDEAIPLVAKQVADSIKSNL